MWSIVNKSSKGAVRLLHTLEVMIASKGGIFQHYSHVRWQTTILWAFREAIITSLVYSLLMLFDTVEMFDCVQCTPILNQLYLWRRYGVQTNVVVFVH